MKISKSIHGNENKIKYKYNEFKSTRIKSYQSQ